MGKGAEIVGFRATNPGAGPTAATVNSGNSFTVRAAGDNSRVVLENLWYQAATTGFVQVRSPRLHDNVRALRLRTLAGATRAEMGDAAEQLLYSQDNLTVELSGGGAETDSGGLLVWYDDLPGIDANYGSWDQIKSQIVNLLTVDIALTTSATVGDWPAGSALNTGSDLLRANTRYALLGYVLDVQVASFAVQGPDTGNLRFGGPGSTEAIDTRDWFQTLSEVTGRPMIPIINSQNKAGTLIFAAGNQNAAAVNADLIFGQLAS